MRLAAAPRWSGGHHPVGDATSGPIRLSFNPQLRVEFCGATVTSDAGLLPPRELDKRLGLDALLERHLINPRSVCYHPLFVFNSDGDCLAAKLQPGNVRSAG